MDFPDFVAVFFALLLRLAGQGRRRTSHLFQQAGKTEISHLHECCLACSSGGFTVPNKPQRNSKLTSGAATEKLSVFLPAGDEPEPTWVPSC